MDVVHVHTPHLSKQNDPPIQKCTQNFTGHTRESHCLPFEIRISCELLSDEYGACILNPRVYVSLHAFSPGHSLEAVKWLVILIYLLNTGVYLKTLELTLISTSISKKRIEETS